MEIAELNHVALLVRDVEASIRFYRDVIGLAAIPRPAFSFPGAWFRLGRVQELHLIEGEAGRGPEEGSRHDHFALRISDVDGAARLLREKGLAFRGPVRRPDGARQIFLRDPDGHVIELCGELP
jgi:catechol 2,3-dioxygenase-like lactoylglutathione lyase family enzyme